MLSHTPLSLAARRIEEDQRQSLRSSTIWRRRGRPRAPRGVRGGPQGVNLARRRGSCEALRAPRGARCDRVTSIYQNPYVFLWFFITFHIRRCVSGRALEVPEGQNPWFSLCFTMILEIVALSAGAYFGLPKRSRLTPVQPNARRTPSSGLGPRPCLFSPAPPRL